MSDFAIRIENLSKKYILGHQQQDSQMLRYAVMQRLKQLPRQLFGKKQTRIEEEFWALKDVSFEIERGDRVGIIGRNGAGKSTLLKILSRITEPTTGRIHLKGRVASLLEVGTGFHPELTGRENIYLNGSILGMSKIEIRKKFDEIVSFAEIERFLDTPVKRYSSGMYVRLAFSVAAYLETDILVVDEVLAVGDVQFQKKCLGKMETVGKEGRTVIFVSHNMGAIERLCDRGIYLESGLVKASGLSERIIQEYLTDIMAGSVEDLQKFRMVGLGQNIWFDSIEFLAEAEGVAAFGQPLQYELIVRSRKDFTDLSIGASIYSLSGSCVGTLFTREIFAIEAGETKRLKLQISNHHLVPGSYYAGFSIGCGNYNSNRQDFDVVIGYPNFQILPIADDMDTISVWHSSWGNVVFQDNKLFIE
ncbi:MAG: polysaccharide ABC transporter ATP-binding protein [Cyanobacteria bacterium P01_E01_bin.42]